MKLCVIFWKVIGFSTEMYFYIIEKYGLNLFRGGIHIKAKIPISMFPANPFKHSHVKKLYLHK